MNGAGRLVVAVLLFAGAVHAQTQAREVVLHNFRANPGGWGPSSGVIRDAEGNLYGTAGGGGLYSGGVVYKMNPAGIETVIYNFTGGADGGNPQFGVAADSHGNLYGTTSSGGPNGYGGVVFKIDTAGRETVLYNFSTSTFRTGTATGGLVVDSGGNIYGVATNEVFKIDTSGNFSVLYAFDYQKYGNPVTPQAALIIDRAGNLLGTTQSGGSRNLGTIFKLSPSGQLTVLHNFGGPGDGSGPATPLTLDSAGYLYGTAAGGTPTYGVVFRIDSTGNETVLYSFTGLADGDEPTSNVVLDAAGN